MTYFTDAQMRDILRVSASDGCRSQQSPHDTAQENTKLDRAVADAELEATTRDYRAKQPHNFDATGAEESNEPLICALCGLDIKNEIYKARAILSIDGSHACALLGKNLQEGEAEFVEIIYPDGKNASDAYKPERAAAFRALYKLRKRLGIEITYALGQGL